MTKLTKMTIRVPAELAERIKFLAHDTCESTSHVAAILLAKALHKGQPSLTVGGVYLTPDPPPKHGLAVRGTYLTPELLNTLRDFRPTGNKILSIKALREAAALNLYEAKAVIDELWTRNDW